MGQAAAFSLAGVSEGTARLAPVAGATLAVAGTALLGARLMGPAPGLLAGAALLSCALFAAFARYVRPETLFLATIQWGFVGLLLGWREGRRGWTLLGAAALGLAAFAKDPLGLVGPLGAVAVALALSGRLRPVSAWLSPAAAGLAVLVGAGWYVLAAYWNPGFLWYVLVDNHARNAARVRLYPDEDLPISALEFAATTALGAFPWIVPAILMIVALARARAWRDCAGNALGGARAVGGRQRGALRGPAVPVAPSRAARVSGHRAPRRALVVGAASHRRARGGLAPRRPARPDRARLRSRGGQ